MRVFALIITALAGWNSIAAGQQSIVTSGGRGSIVISGAANTTRPMETSSAASGKAEQVKTPLASGNPASPRVLQSEIDELRMEIDLMKSTLAAATAPVAPKPTPKPAVKPIAKPVSKSTKVHMNWNISGDWSPTEKETREHLIEDHGRTPESLDGLSFQALLDLHDSLHYGTKTASKSVSKPVVYAQSSCPGGVCPINEVRQRGGRSRRSRR